MAAEGSEFTGFANCKTSRHFEAKYQELAMLLEVSHWGAASGWLKY